MNDSIILCNTIEFLSISQSIYQTKELQGDNLTDFSNAFKSILSYIIYNDGLLLQFNELPIDLLKFCIHIQQEFFNTFRSNTSFFEVVSEDSVA